MSIIFLGQMAYTNQNHKAYSTGNIPFHLKDFFALLALFFIILSYYNL